jgi:hypothetical protein
LTANASRSNNSRLSKERLEGDMQMAAIRLNEIDAGSVTPNSCCPDPKDLLMFIVPV